MKDCHHASNLNLTGLNQSATEQMATQMSHQNHHAHHGHHGHHGNHGNHGHHVAAMKFGIDEIIAFDFWRTNNNLQAFVFSCLGLFLIAALYEGLKIIREELLHMMVTTTRREKSYSKNFQLIENGSPVKEEFKETKSGKFQFICRGFSDHLINWGHLLQTIMHMIQVSVSYFVMLVLMTYNWTICISVVLGAVMGYFLFGYARYRLFSDSSLLNIVNDVNNDDHCT